MKTEALVLNIPLSERMALAPRNVCAAQLCLQCERFNHFLDQNYSQDLGKSTVVAGGGGGAASRGPYM